MNWLKRQWRAFVAEMSVGVGPKNRPFVEIYALILTLAIAAVWLAFKLAQMAALEWS